MKAIVTKITCISETETDSDNKYTGFCEAEIKIEHSEIAMTYKFECTSFNTQTGSEVDAQRLQMAQDYVEIINNL